MGAQFIWNCISGFCVGWCIGGVVLTIAKRFLK